MCDGITHRIARLGEWVIKQQRCARLSAAGEGRLIDFIVSELSIKLISYLSFEFLLDKGSAFKSSHIREGPIMECEAPIGKGWPRRLSLMHLINFIKLIIR